MRNVWNSSINRRVVLTIGVNLLLIATIYLFVIIILIDIKTRNQRRPHSTVVVATP